MDKRTLKRFNKLLEKKISSLIGNFEGTVGQMSRDVEGFPDPTDRATLETDRNFTLRIRDRERKLILKLKKALGRIEDGSYGSCESCGDPIELPRLRARPEATFCIDCKKELELREKRVRRLI